MANRAMMERDMASAPKACTCLCPYRPSGRPWADDRVVDAVKDADKERQKRDGSGGNSHLVCQEHRHKGADPVVDGVVTELGDGIVYSLPERQLDVRGKFRLLFNVGHCFLSFFLF